MNDEKKKKPTPDYNKRASVKYQQKFERLNVLLLQGTKENIKAVYGDISVNQYIRDLIEIDLNKYKKKNDGDELPDAFKL